MLHQTRTRYQPQSFFGAKRVFLRNRHVGVNATPQKIDGVATVPGVLVTTIRRFHAIVPIRPGVILCLFLWSDATNRISGGHADVHDRRSATILTWINADPVCSCMNAASLPQRRCLDVPLFMGGGRGPFGHAARLDKDPTHAVDHSSAHRRDHQKDDAMMNDYGMGYGMGFGWIWMIVVLVLVGLAIAALVKYLRK